MEKLGRQKSNDFPWLILTTPHNDTTEPQNHHTHVIVGPQENSVIREFLYLEMYINHKYHAGGGFSLDAQLVQRVRIFIPLCKLHIVLMVPSRDGVVPPLKVLSGRTIFICTNTCMVFY